MSAATTTKVFVGSIPYSVSEDHLRSEMGQYGRITELFYMQDQMQQNRGWAFVTYSTRDEAVKAINATDAKLMFPGSDRAVEVRFANQKSSSSASSGGGGFQHHGKPHPTPPASYWQRFVTQEGHPYYYNTVTLQTQWERPPEMDMSLAQYGGGGGGMDGPYGGGGPGGGPRGMSGGGPGAPRGSPGPAGANLFIFHIPAEWTDIDLVQHFQHFGCIVSARVQKSPEGRNRGFGFISFDNPQAAYNAIRGMNGFCVNKKFLKVQIKKGEEAFNQAAAALQQQGGMQAGGGLPAAGPFLGIHSHNNPSVRYTPY